MGRKMSDEKRGELIDALLAMRDLLVEPDTWTQGTLARRCYTRSDGRRMEAESVYPTHPQAERFCVVGAAVRVTQQPAARHPVMYYLSGFVQRHFDFGSVQQWNDFYGRSQEEVVGLIELALDELKAGA